MRVLNISDNLPPHWTQRQFEMESLLLHRRPCSVKIVVCKCIAGFACLNEWHNICKPTHQMEHFLHPRAKRKSEEEKLTRWLGEPSVSRIQEEQSDLKLPSFLWESHWGKKQHQSHVAAVKIQYPFQLLTGLLLWISRPAREFILFSNSVSVGEL